MLNRVPIAHLIYGMAEVLRADFYLDPQAIRCVYVRFVEQTNQCAYGNEKWTQDMLKAGSVCPYLSPRCLVEDSRCRSECLVEGEGRDPLWEHLGRDDS